MIARSRFAPAIAAIALSIACADGRPPTPHPLTDPAVAALDGFASGTEAVNGTTLHYVRGGTGPAVVLLHGFPQDWYEYHELMPRLAKRFTVVAADLRGVGGSAATRDGYDAANLAEDIHQLAQKLELGRAYVVGHDLGGIVAYALARLHPDAIRGVMILDVPLPGIAGWEQIESDPALWHIGFHQTRDLPERLVAGRQAIYFDHFFAGSAVDPDAIDDRDVAHYAGAYASVEQLRAVFEMYRALPANAEFNAAQREAIAVPLVLAGGDNGFGPLLPRIADALRRHGWSDVTTELIEHSGHYVADEQPEQVAELIERHASR